MSPIKSLEELAVIRDKHRASIIGRDTIDPEKKIRVAVGMATCGIASGSRETINAIIDELGRDRSEDVLVVQSGCMGYCYAEPTVEIREPGKEPVLYGNITPERARELVKKHIIQGTVIKDWVIEKSFENL